MGIIGSKIIIITSIGIISSNIIIITSIIITMNGINSSCSIICIIISIRRSSDICGSDDKRCISISRMLLLLVRGDDI